MLIENEMLGLVKERYWRLPTVLWNKVISSKEGEPNLDSGGETTIGEETSLAILIPVLVKRLYMYLYIDWKNTSG